MENASHPIDRSRYRHVVLAPHLDDAVLSCGGSIHRWVSAGEHVLVFTFMTADPPDTGRSGYAADLHGEWGVPAPVAFATRRAEEAAALGELGADFEHLRFHDCIYRGNAGGAFYNSDEDIFGRVHPADEPLAGVLAGRLAELGPLGQDATVYAPLSVGNHVDHQLLRRAAELWRGRNLFYYEDFPYAIEDGAVERTLEEARGNAGRRSPLTVPLTEADVLSKVRAVGCYRSQIGVLFGAYVNMAAAVWQYARMVAGDRGWAERLWSPSPSC